MTDARGGSGIPMSAELWRKALHLLSLLIPVGLFYLGRETALYTLVPVTLTAIIIEVARARAHWAHDLVDKVFGFMMRPEEIPDVPAAVRFNGATWVLTTATVLVILFPPAVAAAAITIGLVGDAAAAVVGRRFGRLTIFGTDKTVEGSLAFVACTLPLAWIFPGVTLIAAAVGVCVGAVIEAWHPIPINDNFAVPMAAALAMILVLS